MVERQCTQSDVWETTMQIAWALKPIQSGMHSELFILGMIHSLQILLDPLEEDLRTRMMAFVRQIPPPTSPAQLAFRGDVQ